MKWILGLCLCASVSARTPAMEPSPEAVAKLEANGFVILDQPLRQGFSSYIDSTRPVFITSDSLLMVWGRVFEESMSREELAIMGSLRRGLPAMWRNLPAAPLEETPAAREGLRHARLTLACAQRLLTGHLPEGLSQEEADEVMAEVTRVESYQGRRGPAWLESDKLTPEYVAYPLFDPGSYGNGNPAMQRYYRCRKWLQEMQIDSHEEALASMVEHLALAVGRTDPALTLAFTWPPGDTEHPGFFDNFDGRDARLIRSQDWNLESVRSHLKIRDPRLGRFMEVQVPFGSDAARALLKTGEAGQAPMIVAAALGNPLATAALDERLLKHAKREGRHLPGAFFRALQELNVAPDPRSPTFMKSEAWQRKQLNTTLGSWAEYRYALQLSSREDAIFAGEGREQPGFVEPVPKFFQKLGAAAEARATYYSAIPALKLASVDAAAFRLEALPQALRSLKDEAAYIPGLNAIQPQQELLSRLFPAIFDHKDFLGFEGSTQKLFDDLASQLEELLKRYWADDPLAVATLQKEVLATPDELGTSLWKLAMLSIRLEAMAERQLAGSPWTEEEEIFIQSYGYELARIMFYQGNSYLHPEDNAPRIARYASTEDGIGVDVLHAATARPRLLLVRYPAPDGKEVLCRGAVYAYRDVPRPAVLPLKTWQAESEKSPWPAWSAPIVGAHIAAESDQARARLYKSR
ncbi:DUF3160 domain-containing protein [Luteolibacter sp. GHJ8]|uniref:DUF3160 domain-containing protein n=1 Tax=Luteolibacter rhizosphaerae TaxID=2989719 RepID=A0ABT3G0U2_9BACT|nr:DUF3160 domain-containing protein [Luteolibacter rhizosphaerae]MCW1912845.1 DUF3160 domain-containing protein [Luteolibacter rhizosphaerae]